MRVHTRVVTCMITGETLEDEYYEYDGPVALCFGGGGDEVKETDEVKELARISQERWDRYKDVYVPLENAYMKTVDSFDSEANREALTSSVAGGIKTDLSNQMTESNTQMLAGGVNPNDGAFKGISTAALTKGSAVLANAVNTANMNLGSEKINRKQGVVQMGQGQATGAVKSFADISDTAQSTAIAGAEADFNAGQSWGNLAGNVAGAYTRYGLNSPTATTPKADSFSTDAVVNTSGEEMVS